MGFVEMLVHVREVNFLWSSSVNAAPEPEYAGEALGSFGLYAGRSRVWKVGYQREGG